MSFFNNLSSLFGDQEPGAKKRKGVTQRKRKPTVSKKTVSKQKTSTNKDRKLKNKKVKSKSRRYNRVLLERKIAEAKSTADTIIREANAKAKEIIVEAKDQALIIHSKAEKKLREQETSFMKQQSYLDKKLDKVEKKLDRLEREEKLLKDKHKKVDQTQQEVDKIKDKLLKRLEEISGLSREEAKDILFSGLETKLSNEMAQFIRSKKEEAKLEATERGREILVDAMKYAATDYVAEYTVSVLELPSEDVKGKIIGKSGRNIHSFERLTGVDVDLDSAATEVRLSSFDPIRREIARVALKRLIKDGRIQPARIEQQVEKARNEIDKTIYKAGKELCHTVGVYNIPAGLIKLLGRFKYRFSYGQNMIVHTIEETKLGVKLAHELGLDVDIVRLGCLLHDIGKVSDEIEGNHVELGVKICQKYNLPQPIIDCVAQHHEDEEFSGPEQMAVYIADAISGARPGARYENHEEYVKRLEDMEEIATSYSEVKEAYAIQAGREMRVLLRPEKSKDQDVEIIAIKLKDEIRDKVIIPGSLTVTVMRQVRASKVSR